MKKIKARYFDNGSTSSPKAPGVARAVFDYLSGSGVNVGRGGYAAAYALEEAVVKARVAICGLFGAEKPQNVVFTSGITHSLNLVLKGFLKPGDHVILSGMEHNAVMRPLGQLANRGVEFSCTAHDEKGNLDVASLPRLIRPHTRAVVMLHASNVCGALMPLKEVGGICREHGLRFIVDSAQTAWLYPINMNELHIDALTFAGHKTLRGPQGIGGVVFANGMQELVEPLIAGGTGSASNSELVPAFMPDRFEAGTLNLPGILGLKAALDYLQTQNAQAWRAQELKVCEALARGIEEIKGIRTVGWNGQAGMPVLSLDFADMDNAAVAYRLGEEYGVMTRCGLHCAPRSHKTLGTFPAGTVRFTPGPDTALEDAQYVLDALKEIVIG